MRDMSDFGIFWVCMTAMYIAYRFSWAVRESRVHEARIAALEAAVFEDEDEDENENDEKEGT
jgi:hypothetical protein